MMKKRTKTIVLSSISFIFLWGINSAYAATININTTADIVADDNQCSLREAITAANMNMPSGMSANECIGGTGVGDIINFPSMGGKFLFSPGKTDLHIKEGLTLNGKDDLVTIDAGNQPTTVFSITTGANEQTIFNNLRITGGNGSGEGTGIRIVGGNVELNNSHVFSNTSFFRGGGIFIGAGLLQMKNSTVTLNKTSSRGGGIAVGVNGNLIMINSTVASNTAVASGGEGGGIFSEGNVSIQKSTISENSSKKAGGGIATRAYGTLNITNTTVSGNMTNGDIFENAGGGILVADQSKANLVNVTVSNNKSDVNNDNSGAGGGIATRDTGIITLQNTIIAGNTDNTMVAPDCAFIALSATTAGNNLIGNSKGCNFTAGGTDILNINPLLENLGNVTGYNTQVHVLKKGSPAIGTGATIPGMTDDQGETARPQGANFDIGSFELVETVVIDPPPPPENNQCPAGLTDVNGEMCVWIKYVYDNKIMTGYGNTKFGPNDLFQRDQGAKVALLAGKHTLKTDTECKDFNAFPDVTKQDWSFLYVCTSYKGVQVNNKLIQVIFGYLGGPNKGLFVPAGKLTRMEGLALLVRAKGIQTPVTNDIPSDISPDHWAVQQGIAQYAKTHNLFGTNLMPDKAITRSELAKLVYDLRNF